MRFPPIEAALNPFGSTSKLKSGGSDLIPRGVCTIPIPRAEARGAGEAQTDLI